MDDKKSGGGVTKNNQLLSFNHRGNKEKYNAFFFISRQGLSHGLKKKRHAALFTYD